MKQGTKCLLVGLGLLLVTGCDDESSPRPSRAVRSESGGAQRREHASRDAESTPTIENAPAYIEDAVTRADQRHANLRTGALPERAEPFPCGGRGPGTLELTVTETIEGSCPNPAEKRRAAITREMTLTHSDAGRDGVHKFTNQGGRSLKKGTDDVFRGAVATVGLGANVPEDAIYPLMVADGRAGSARRLP